MTRDSLVVDLLFSRKLFHNCSSLPQFALIHRCTSVIVARFLNASSDLSSGNNGGLQSVPRAAVNGGEHSR